MAIFMSIAGFFIKILDFIIKKDNRKTVSQFWILCGRHHQTAILSLIVFLVILGSSTLFYLKSNLLLPSGLIVTPYSVVIPANIAIILIIIVIGLPRPQRQTILDLIPQEHLNNYFASTEVNSIRHSKERAKVSCNKFATYWKISFISMVFLYVFLAGISLMNRTKIPPLTVDFITNFCDVISTTFFCGCLIILSRSTFDLTEKKPKFKMPTLYTLIWIVAIVIIFFDFLTLFNQNVAQYKVLISLLVGLYGGFIFARFTGRIDSKFIRTPGWMIFIFYFYAFLLILFPLLHTINSAFSESEAAKFLGVDNWTLGSQIEEVVQAIIIIMFVLSFLLKVFITLSIIWLFKMNKMLIYFVRMNRLQLELENNDIVVQRIHEHNPEQYNLHVMR